MFLASLSWRCGANGSLVQVDMITLQHPDSLNRITFQVLKSDLFAVAVAAAGGEKMALGGWGLDDVVWTGAV